MKILNIILMFILFILPVRNITIIKQNSSYTHNSINKLYSNPNGYLSFQDNYISQYNGNNEDALLNVNLDTNNLNTTDNFYFANCYGYLVYYQPVKWEYHFPISIYNTSLELPISFNNLTYENIENNEQIPILSNLNIIKEINNFISNFFSDSTCNIPKLLINNCENLNNINNFLTINGNFRNENPNLNFSSYEKYNLFTTSSNINVASFIKNVNISAEKNPIFATLYTGNINKNFTYNINNILQIDRFFANFQTNKSTYKLNYGNNTNLNINISFDNVNSEIYIFNPELLFKINIPPLLNEDEPYTNYANLKVNINTDLLNSLFKANLIYQLINILNNQFNNQNLKNLLNEIWTKKFFNINLFNNILNLLGNEYNYSPTTNTLSLDIKNGFNLNNLILLLQSYLLKPEIANWYNQLFNLYSNIDINGINFINLYQTLLKTYKDSNLNINFKTNNDSNNEEITFSQNSILLTNNLVNKIIKPYEYIYEITEITLNLNNELINLNQNYSFEIIKYPYLITDNPNLNAFFKYDNQELFNLVNLNLQDYSFISNDLMLDLKINNTELNNIINIFNLNYKYPEWISNEIFVNKNVDFIQLFYVDIYLCIFNNLIDSNSNLMNFILQYNFNENILENSCSNLINNINITASKNFLSDGIINATFDISNEISFYKNLSKCEEIFGDFNPNYNNYFSNLSLNLCTNQSLLTTSNNKNASPNNHNTIKNNITNHVKTNKTYKNKYSNNTLSIMLLLLLLPVVVIILFTIYMVKKYKYKSKIKRKKG